MNTKVSVYFIKKIQEAERDMDEAKNLVLGEYLLEPDVVKFEVAEAKLNLLIDIVKFLLENEKN